MLKPANGKRIISIGSLLSICFLLMPMVGAVPSVAITTETDVALYPLENRVFEVQVTNIGAETLPWVFMEVTLDAPLVFAGNGRGDVLQKIAFKNILPGETKRKPLTIQAQNYTTLTPSILIVYGESQTPLPNQVSRVINLVKSPLAFQVRMSQAVAAPGDEITVTIDLRNESTDTLNDIQILVSGSENDNVEEKRISFDVMQADQQFLGNQLVIEIPEPPGKEIGISTAVTFTINGTTHTLSQVIPIQVQDGQGLIGLGAIVLAVILIVGGGWYWMSRRMNSEKIEMTPREPADETEEDETDPAT